MPARHPVEKSTLFGCASIRGGLRAGCPPVVKLRKIFISQRTLGRPDRFCRRRRLELLGWRLGPGRKARRLLLGGLFSLGLYHHPRRGFLPVLGLPCPSPIVARCGAAPEPSSWFVSNRR